MSGEAPPVRDLEVAALSRAGRGRAVDEDCAGSFLEGPGRAVVAVADGVSGGEAGEVASRMAVEATLRAFREQRPSLGAGQRLYRAVQQANIEVYDRAMAVPELRGMSTTLTAASVDGAVMTAVHVGDSRLYLVRGGAAIQLSKDHTLAAQRGRRRVLGAGRRGSPEERSVLTRSVGRELIVIRDRITHPLEPGDLLLICSDGVHNLLADTEMARLVHGREAAAACQALLEAAERRGLPDDATAAVVRIPGGPSGPPRPATSRLSRLLARLLERAPRPPGGPGTRSGPPA